MIYLIAAIASLIFVVGGVFLLRASANKEYFQQDVNEKKELVTLITRDRHPASVEKVELEIIPELSVEKKQEESLETKELQKSPDLSRKIEIYKDNLSKAKDQTSAFNLRDILYASTPSFRVDETTNSIVEEKQKQYPLRRVKRIGIDNVHTVQKLIDQQLSSESMIIFYIGENSDGIYHTTASGTSVQIWYPSMK